MISLQEVFEIVEKLKGRCVVFEDLWQELGPSFGKHCQYTSISSRLALLVMSFARATIDGFDREGNLSRVNEDLQASQRACNHSSSLLPAPGDKV